MGKWGKQTAFPQLFSPLCKVGNPRGTGVSALSVPTFSPLLRYTSTDITKMHFLGVVGWSLLAIVYRFGVIVVVLWVTLPRRFCRPSSGQISCRMTLICPSVNNIRLCVDLGLKS